MRYSAAKEREVPLFRTLQWSWFVVAIFYTYGDFLHEFVLQHRALLWLSHVTMYNAWLSFVGYCCVFVVSVLTLKKGLYKYQASRVAGVTLHVYFVGGGETEADIRRQLWLGQRLELDEGNSLSKVHLLAASCPLVCTAWGMAFPHRTVSISGSCGSHGRCAAPPFLVHVPASLAFTLHQCINVMYYHALLHPRFCAGLTPHPPPPLFFRAWNELCR